MDAETRAAFGRMDHFFELMQAQHLEVRADLAGVNTRLSGIEERMSGVEGRLSGLEERMSGVEGRLSGVEGRLSSLEERMSALEESLRSFRDWVTIQFAELRSAIEQLTVRVERLERRADGAVS